MSFNYPFEPAELKPIFNYSAANWNLFHTGILNHLNMQCLQGNCSIREIDVEATHLTDIILMADRQAIPLKTSSYSSLQISASTRALIQKRNRLRNRWQRTHDIALRPIINSLKDEIDFAIKQQVSDSWSQSLQALNTTNMRDTWRITKRLTREPLNITPLTYNGFTAITIPDKLKAFADSLQKAFTANPDNNKHFTLHIEQLVQDFLHQPFSGRERPTNPSEVAWLIRHIRPRSAPGPDGIQNIVLQHLPQAAFKFIATLFNKSLALSYFPSQWKVAKLLMFPKPGKDLTSPINYRPIRLLNSLGKIFEKKKS
jgi:hypothetical protein